MLNISKVFGGPKKSSVEDLERVRAELAAEVLGLEGNADYRALLRGERIKKEVARLKSRLSDLDLEIAAERRRNLPPPDPRVTAAIRQLVDEKFTTCKRIETRGVLERNFIGGVKGFLITNEAKIKAHLAELDRAIGELDHLKTSELEDVAAEITRIQSTVGVLDASTEKIKTTAGIAASLQG